MSSNLVKRIFTCVIGIPAVAALIFLFPQYNFIGLSILILAFSVLGGMEMSRMIFGSFSPVVILSSGICLVKYFQPFSGTDIDFASYLFLLSIIIVLTAEIRAGEKDNFEQSVSRIGRSILLLVYPGYLLSFIIGMLALENTTPYSLLLFLCLVFSNDIFAYVFGMLFGRGHAGIVKVSPKKSLQGFIGGFAGSISISLLFFALFEDLPHVSFPVQILLGAIISFSANIGDLAESVFKRCAKVKDSGTLIPGRGGILDNMDSVIVSAPFFYIIWNLI